MNLFSKIALVFIFSVSRASSETSYDPADWPKYQIEFSEEGTLTDLFLSGLTPYRFPALERTSLQAKHARISFLLHDGKITPEIDVEWMNISVLDKWLLSSLEMTSPNLSLKEAKTAMTAYLPKGSRTAQELTEFLAAVHKDHRRFDDSPSKFSDKFQTRWEEPQGPSYSIFFKPTFNKEYPLSIALKLSWASYREKINMRARFPGPIPPPPGFEDISMEAPENFGPDSAVDIARSRGEDIGDGTGPIYKYRPPGWRPEQKVAAKREPKPTRTKPAQASKQKNSWPYFLGALVVLAAVFGGIKVWKERSAA